jgi:hypothetical protein
MKSCGEFCMCKRALWICLSLVSIRWILKGDSYLSEEERDDNKYEEDSK